MRTTGRARISRAIGVAACAGFAASCGGGGSSGSGASTSTSTSASTSTPTPTATAAPGLAQAPAPPTSHRSKTATVVARSGEGFLEEQAGYRILHVKGTPYDRGVQAGELIGDEIAADVGVLTSYGLSMQSTIPQSFAPIVQPLLSALSAALYKPGFPPDVLEEIQGAIDGAARRSPPVVLQESDLIFLNSIIDSAATAHAVYSAFVPPFKCSGTAVLPPLTANGKTFQERNVDLFVGTGLESHALVVIEKPAGQLAWANATWAGMLGSASGMNEHGVAVSQVWAASTDVAIGQPWILTAKHILETCENVDPIESIFASVPRTYGSNFVFADRGDGRGSPSAIALDSTAHLLAQFHDADPDENASWQGNALSIRVPHAVFRGDTSLWEPIFQLEYDLGSGDPRSHGGYCDRYAQQATMIQSYQAAGTPIGLAEMEAISKKIAEPGGSLQCVVYENSDLALHVANSRIVPNAAPAMARDEPFHDFDFDYYLPTVQLTPDKTSYAAGDAVTLALDVEDHGRARSIDAWVLIETSAGSFPLSTAPVASVQVSPGQAGHATATLAFPVVPAGTATFVVELDEGGTRDVVDFATASVTAK